MTPDAQCRATIRSARLGLIAAVESGDAAAVDSALVTYVGALHATSFSVITIHALVEAALGAGLPPERWFADRKRRARLIAGWLLRADRLLDELPPLIPTRPGQLRGEEDAYAPRRAQGLA